MFLPCPQSTIACTSWASVCLSPVQTLAYSSELPLPMPVQCDDIEDGARVGVIAIQRGQVTMVRAVCTAGIVATPAGRVAESGRDAASCADTEHNVVPNADANRGNDRDLNIDSALIDYLDLNRVARWESCGSWCSRPPSATATSACWTRRCRQSSRATQPTLRK